MIKQRSSESAISTALVELLQNLTTLEMTLRPVGQVVKTPPFHGGNTSSTLVRVILRHIQQSYSNTRSIYLGSIKRYR